MRKDSWVKIGAVTAIVSCCAGILYGWYRSQWHAISCSDLSEIPPGKNEFVDSAGLHWKMVRFYHGYVDFKPADWECGPGMDVDPGPRYPVQPMLELK
jgi:hypothetical protein